MKFDWLNEYRKIKLLLSCATFPLPIANKKSQIKNVNNKERRLWRLRSIEAKEVVKFTVLSVLSVIFGMWVLYPWGGEPFEGCVGLLNACRMIGNAFRMQCKKWKCSVEMWKFSGIVDRLWKNYLLLYHSNLSVKPLSVSILGDRGPLSAGHDYLLECVTHGSRPAATVTWWKANKFQQGLFEQKVSKLASLKQFLILRVRSQKLSAEILP